MGEEGHDQGGTERGWDKASEAEDARVRAYVQWVTHPKRGPIALGMYGES